MTTPLYKFNDDRLRAYLDYLQGVLDPMTDELNGISMTVNIASEFSGGIVASVLYSPKLEFEVTDDELPISGGPYLSRVNVDLTLFREVRLTVHVIDDDSSEGVMRLQYSPDNGSNWYDIGDTTQTEIDFTGVGGDVNLKSAWVSLASGAQGDVLLRLYGYDTTQFPPGKYPVVDNINAEVRTLWSFEDPVMTYDERIQYLSDNQLPPFD